MNDEHTTETFQFTYSAREQEELEKIRSKYMPREETRLERLQRLDAAVTRRAAVRAVIVGLLGTLLLGFGMSLAMTDLGTSMGLGKTAFALGIPVGVLGLLLVVLACPIYFRVLKKERAKAAPEILRLTDELMK